MMTLTSSSNEASRHIILFPKHEAYSAIKDVPYLPLLIREVECKLWPSFHSFSLPPGSEVKMNLHRRINNIREDLQSFGHD